ncbi:signal peptidase I [Enterococcus diestrammenae]|uniref:Signal peptidase I n=1 Tax=Enterococcus diestrammenae TaxID=1155073 RepID=A0ABV0F807_9ENTE|nr:signal peptidase I [Enterococcus diestrammenae]
MAQGAKRTAKWKLPSRVVLVLKAGSHLLSGIVTSLLVMVILLGGFLQITASLDNPPLQLVTVLTGSMAQYYPPGSVLLIRELAPESLMKGDVITFEKHGETVTHRIVTIVARNPLTFETKGDNNTIMDRETVTAAEVQGKVVTHLPKIGRLLLLLATPAGKRAGILTLLQLGLLVEFLKQIKGVLKDEKAKSKIDLDGNCTIVGNGGDDVCLVERLQSDGDENHHGESQCHRKP